VSLREQIVAEARRWLGTPFHHQGRLLGAGVDCVGVVIGVGRALGLTQFDTTDYGRLPVPDRMLGQLSANLVPVAVGEIGLGDILWMRIDRDPQHLAIVSGVAPRQIVHAYEGVGRCVEHGLDGKWQRRVVRAWRFAGVV